MREMYIIRMFENWELSLRCSPYGDYPKECKHLKEHKGDLIINHAYFNLSTPYTRKIKADNRTLQYLNIKGQDCAYGGTEEKITLPNGDITSGFTLGIKDGKVIEKDTSTRRTRNALGTTCDGVFFNIQSSHFITLKGLCEYVNKKLKVKLLLLNDGGGSTGCYSQRTKLHFAPEGSRPVPSVLVATYKGEPIKRTLKLGCTGEDVKLLQMFLARVECDGIFGQGTKRALIQAQRNLKLVPDGIAGPKTLKKLFGG